MTNQDRPQRASYTSPFGGLSAESGGAVVGTVGCVFADRDKTDTGLYVLSSSALFSGGSGVYVGNELFGEVCSLQHAGRGLGTDLAAVESLACKIALQSTVGWNAIQATSFEKIADQTECLGQRVFKYGEATGKTEGRVKALASAFEMKRPDSDQIAVFAGALRIRSEDGKPFAAKGDVGALIRTENGDGVGVLVAGAGEDFFAIPLEVLIQQYGLVKPSELDVTRHNRTDASGYGALLEEIKTLCARDVKHWSRHIAERLPLLMEYQFSGGDEVRERREDELKAFVGEMRRLVGIVALERATRFASTDVEAGAVQWFVDAMVRVAGVEREELDPFGFRMSRFFELSRQAIPDGAGDSSKVSVDPDSVLGPPLAAMPAKPELADV